MHWDILQDFSLCTLHCRHVHNHYWSGVFNLLKFDRTPKMKKKKAQAVECKIYVSAKKLSGIITTTMMSLKTALMHQLQAVYWLHQHQI